MPCEIQVGDWLVKPDLNRISRAGQTIRVEPKVMDVLLALAQHPGEVLAKERIIRQVWPDIYVSDGILGYCISELRKAFGDDARQPHVIQTISRKGYRLIAPVTLLSPEPTKQPSIAVLPFSDMSPQQDQQYFCDGIAEEIISILTQVKGLRVAARTSSFAFKGKNEDIRTLGRMLNVSTVLEGSVRKSGEQLRINVQLINAENGCHLWSERYHRQLKDVFDIQDEIARTIATTLRITLGPSENEALGRAPTTSHQAYDYYLRGKQFFAQYNKKGIEFASRMFTQAIELDPAFALAYAGIADCGAFLYLYAGNRETHRQQSDAASSLAIFLDPESAAAHVSRAVALSLQEAFPEAEAEFETAIHLDPQLFEAYYCYARVAFIQGKFEQAVRLYEKASQVHPQDYQAPLLAAQIYWDLGRKAEADAVRWRGVQLASARLKLNPDDERALYMGANGLVALGERERGLEWARQALEMDPNDPMLLYNVACIQCLAGKPEEALESLEKAIANGLMQKNWPVLL